MFVQNPYVDNHDGLYSVMLYENDRIVQILKFKELIRKHNDEVLSNKEHPGVSYRAPSVLIIICANATMAYTAKNGVKVIPIGCLRN